jgi:hypothetical protein
MLRANAGITSWPPKLSGSWKGWAFELRTVLKSNHPAVVAREKLEARHDN